MNENRCPNCGQQMAWEFDTYGTWICWPCAENEDPDEEAYWESLMNDEPELVDA